MHRKEENHSFCHQVITDMVFWSPAVAITSHTWPMIRDPTIANLRPMINRMNPTTANSSKTCDQEVFSPGEPLDAWHWLKIWIRYLANIWAAWCRGCSKCFQFLVTKCRKRVVHSSVEAFADFCDKLQERGNFWRGAPWSVSDRWDHNGQLLKSVKIHIWT